MQSHTLPVHLHRMYMLTACEPLLRHVGAMSRSCRQRSQSTALPPFDSTVLTFLDQHCKGTLCPHVHFLDPLEQCVIDISVVYDVA